VASLAPPLACPRVIPNLERSTAAALDDELQEEWSKSMHGKARDWEALLLAYTP
jgi:hypothetical protein